MGELLPKRWSSFVRKQMAQRNELSKKSPMVMNFVMLMATSFAPASLKDLLNLVIALLPPPLVIFDHSRICKPPSIGQVKPRRMLSCKSNKKSSAEQHVRHENTKWP